MGPRSRIIVLMALASALCASLHRCEAQNSQFRIVFDERQDSSDPDQCGPDSDIYITDLSGQHTKRITKDHRNHSPSWSPDGKAIIFLRDRQSAAISSRGTLSILRDCLKSSRDVFTLDTGGAGLHALISGTSPDLQKVAWLSGDAALLFRFSNKIDLKVLEIPADWVEMWFEEFTSEQIQHTHRPHPVWWVTMPKPGSLQLAAQSGPLKIRKYSFDRVSESNGFRSGIGEFSPPVDNLQSVFVRFTGSGPAESHTPPLDPRDERNITALLSFRDSLPFDPDPTAHAQLKTTSGNDLPTPVSAYDVAWSLDGKQIAWSKSSDNRNAALFVADLRPEGVSKALQITQPLLDAHDPTWSPDGRRLAFAGRTNHGQQIFVINVDGTGLVQLGEDQGTSRVGVDPTLECKQPSWSPDGHWLVAECQNLLQGLSSTPYHDVDGLYSSVYRFDVTRPRSRPHVLIDCRPFNGADQPQRLPQICGAHNPSFAPVVH